jgi:hypothetical protein
LSAAKAAVRSSKTDRATPPVLTRSKTRQTASLRRFLLQLDDRELVLLEPLDDLTLETVIELDLLRRVIPVLVVGLSPLSALEGEIRGEKVGGIFPVRRRHIHRDLAAEGLDLLALGDAHDRVFTVVVAVHRFLHVEVVPAANRLALRILGLDH